MVRRWSRLNDINLSFQNFSIFNKMYKLKIFRSVVWFKRFSTGFTKLKRKAFIRMKHRSTFLIYTNVIKFWISDYFFNKKTTQFIYFFQITTNMFLTYFFISNQFKLKQFTSGINFFLITKKNYNMNIKHANLFLNWLDINAPLTPNIPYLYSSGLELYQVTNKQTFELFNLENFFMFNYIQRVLEIYKIFSILYYNQINTLNF